MRLLAQLLLHHDQLALPVRADLPVHCLLQDVVGKWIFYADDLEEIQSHDPLEVSTADAGGSDNAAGDRSVELQRSLLFPVPRCGHSVPNTALSMNGMDQRVEVGQTLVAVPAEGDPAEPEVALLQMKKGREEMKLRGNAVLRVEVELTDEVLPDGLGLRAIVNGGESAVFSLVADVGVHVRWHRKEFFAHFDTRRVNKFADWGARIGSVEAYPTWRDIVGFQGIVNSTGDRLPPLGRDYLCKCDVLSAGWHSLWSSGRSSPQQVGGERKTFGCFWGHKATKNVADGLSDMLPGTGLEHLDEAKFIHKRRDEAVIAMKRKRQSQKSGYEVRLDRTTDVAFGHDF